MSITNFSDSETLETYIRASAMFILIYEHFEDLVIETVRGRFSNPTIIDGEMKSTLDPEYIKALDEKICAGEESVVSYSLQKSKAVRNLDRYEYAVKIGKYKEEKNKNKDGNIFRGSLDRLTAQGIFNKREKAWIWEIRTRRNNNPPDECNSCNSTIPADYKSRRETTSLRSVSLRRSFFTASGLHPYIWQLCRCEQRCPT